MMKTGMSSGLSREKPSLVQISVALGETYSKSGGAETSFHLLESNAFDCLCILPDRN